MAEGGAMKKTSTNTPPPHPGLDGKVRHAKLEPENSVAGNGKPEGGPKILHRLSELTAAPVTATTYLCLAEKDADALAKIGFVATTASEGAAWDPADPRARPGIRRSRRGSRIAPS